MPGERASRVAAVQLPAPRGCSAAKTLRNAFRALLGTTAHTAIARPVASRATAGGTENVDTADGEPDTTFGRDHRPSGVRVAASTTDPPDALRTQTTTASPDSLIAST